MFWAEAVRLWQNQFAINKAIYVFLYMFRKQFEWTASSSSFSRLQLANGAVFQGNQCAVLPNDPHTSISRLRQRIRHIRIVIGKWIFTCAEFVNCVRNVSFVKTNVCFVRNCLIFRFASTPQFIKRESSTEGKAICWPKNNYITRDKHLIKRII